MAAVLGLMAAFTIGLSDLFGRRVVSASSAVTAALTLQFGSAVALLTVAIATRSAFSLELFIWGGVSGLGLGVGISSYYYGLIGSTATVVAPMVAALAAVLPFSYTVARGATVGPVQVVGALTAAVGLVLVSGGSASKAQLRAGLFWGTMSGLGYSLGAVGFVEAATADGWWPTVGQRGAALILLLVAAAVLRQPPLPPKQQWKNGLMSAVTTAVTSMLYLASLSIDPTVGVIAIAAFPAFSVLIGRTFFGDSVSVAQAVGIGLVIFGVASVTVG